MTDEATTFICPRSASLIIGIDVEGVRKKMQFKHHALVLSGVEADAMHTLLNAVPKLKLKIRVVDKNAAEALVKRHMAQNRGGAISGSFHSGHGNLQERDEELRAQGVTDEGLAKLQTDISKDNDMLLTEKDPVANKAATLAKTANAPVKEVRESAKPEPKTLGGIKLG